MAVHRVLRRIRMSLPAGRASRRLELELLEDRIVPSVDFKPAPFVVPRNNTDLVPWPAAVLNGSPAVEPQITVNPTNPENLVLSSFNLLGVSTDGGKTYTQKSFPALPGTFLNAGDTSTVFDSRGQLYWANLGGIPIPGSNPVQLKNISVFLTKVNPQTGAPTGPLVQVTHPTSSQSDDKEFLAADDSGNLFMAWISSFNSKLQNGNTVSNGEVLLSRSTTQGATWSNPKVVDALGASAFDWPVTLSVAPNGDLSHGEVYVAYHNEPQNASPKDPHAFDTVYVARYSNDLSRQISWTPACDEGRARIRDGPNSVQTTGHPKDPQYPGTDFYTIGAGQSWVLADPVRPRNVYVIYIDDPSNGGAGDPANIMISRSSNYGAPGSWTTQTVEAGPNNSMQLFVTAAIDPFGDIAIAWYDNRAKETITAGPGKGNFKWDFYAKYSTDGGLHWTAAFKVSDKPLDPDTNNLAADNRGVRIGDYYGIALFGDTAYVAWEGNTFMGTAVTGDQLYTDSFNIPGSLTVHGSEGNDSIGMQGKSGGGSNPDTFEVIVNNVRVYAGRSTNISSVTISSGDGADTITLGSLTGPLESMPSDISVSSGIDQDTTLTVDARDSSHSIFTVTDKALQRSEQHIVLGHLLPVVTNTITYQRISRLLVRGDLDSPSTFQVQSTAAPTPVTLGGGTMDDTFHIGDANNALGDIASPLTVDGLRGTDSLIVDDQFAVSRFIHEVSRGFTVTAGQVQRQLTPALLGKKVITSINYANVEGVQILGNSRPTSFQVLSTLAPVRVRIQGGGGNDAFAVGDRSDSLDDVRGLVTVDGGGGTNSLVVDDRFPAGLLDRELSHSITVTDDQVKRIRTLDGLPQVVNTTTVNIANIGPLTVLGNARATNDRDLTTPAGPQVSFQAGGLDSLVVDDRSFGSATITIAAQSILYTARIPGAAALATAIAYTGMQSVTVLGSTTAATTFLVQSTAATTPVFLVGGAAHDSFTVGDSQHSLDAVAGPVSVAGQGNADSLIVDDRFAVLPQESSRSFTITNKSVQRTRTLALDLGQAVFSTTVSYANIESVQVFGNNLATSYVVPSSAAGIPVDIAAGDGNDSIAVGALHSLDGLAAAVTFHGNGGNNGILTLDDSAAITPRFYSLGAAEFDRAGSSLVIFSQLAGITVDTGAGNNMVDVTGTAIGAPVTFNGGAGPQEEIGILADQNALLAPVAIHCRPSANDLVEYVDTSNPAPQTYTFTSGTVSRSGLVDVTFDGLEQILLFAPAVGGSSVRIQSSAPGTLVNILDYNADHVVVGSLAPTTGGDLKQILGTLEIHTTDPSAQVSLTVDDSGNTGGAAQQVTFGTDGGHFIYMGGLAPVPIIWSFSPTSSVTVLGGAADKTFALQPFVAGTPLTILAGGGTNTLDYSAYSTAVAVNLVTRTATDLAGFASFQDVTGGAGSNVLVGNGGNVLTGGSGPNLLIAGATPSTLIGGSGNDILIGGSTDYDTDLQALASLLAAWVQAADYNSAVASVLGFPLQPGHEVHANAGGNTLTGGEGLDLFFASLGDVTDRNGIEGLESL